METWAHSIRDEITFLIAQGVQEQSLQIQSLIKSGEEAAKRGRIEAHRRVLDWCSTYVHETTWTESRKLGKATWFQETPEYQNWKTSAQSSTLFCRGKLGSGKSVVLAQIVGDLVVEPTTGPCTVAFFFCRHDIRDGLLADTVIRSLARQLLRPIPDLTVVEPHIDPSRPVPDERNDSVSGLSSFTT
jgi:predicted transcriptional regulator